MKLGNQTCVITVEYQGTGRSTVLAFAKEGAKVIATDINLEHLKNLQKEAESKKSEVDVLFNCVDRVPAGSAYFSYRV